MTKQENTKAIKAFAKSSGYVAPMKGREGYSPRESRGLTPKAAATVASLKASKASEEGNHKEAERLHGEAIKAHEYAMVSSRERDERDGGNRAESHEKAIANHNEGVRVARAGGESKGTGDDRKRDEQGRFA